jgi:hypothetical protein
MKNTLNYKRFLKAEAKRHLGMAWTARIMQMEKHWERHMHYARQAIRMAGVL